MYFTVFLVEDFNLNVYKEFEWDNGYFECDSLGILTIQENYINEDNDDYDYIKIDSNKNNISFFVNSVLRNVDCETLWYLKRNNDNKYSPLVFLYINHNNKYDINLVINELTKFLVERGAKETIS